MGVLKLSPTLPYSTKVIRNSPETREKTVRNAEKNQGLGSSGFGDGGEEGGDVVGAELGFALGEKPRAEARGLAEEDLVDEEVVGAGDLAVVVEVALLPGGPPCCEAAVEEGVVVGVEFSVEGGVAGEGEFDEVAGVAEAVGGVGGRAGEAGGEEVLADRVGGGGGVEGGGFEVDRGSVGEG